MADIWSTFSRRQQVLAHYAVRWLMHSAATVHRTVARELSFAAHVQIMRTAWPRSGAFPPRATTT